MILLLACSTTGEVEFKAGDYQFSTTDMSDDCLDGALEALFMPQGRTTPQEFEFPVYVPSLDELPASYEVSLREPFVGMPVTVTEAPNGLQFEGAVMDEVLINQSLYGDCVATMTVDSKIWPESSKAGTGVAEIDISAWRGSEGRCPSPDADPCLVTLELELERL